MRSFVSVAVCHRQCGRNNTTMRHLLHPCQLISFYWIFTSVDQGAKYAIRIHCTFSTAFILVLSFRFILFSFCSFISRVILYSMSVCVYVCAQQRQQQQKIQVPTLNNFMNLVAFRGISCHCHPDEEMNTPNGQSSYRNSLCYAEKRCRSEQTQWEREWNEHNSSQLERIHVNSFFGFFSFFFFVLCCVSYFFLSNSTQIKVVCSL